MTKHLVAILLGAVCLVVGVGLTTGRWELASRWDTYRAQVLKRQETKRSAQPGKVFLATPLTLGLPLAYSAS